MTQKSSAASCPECGADAGDNWFDRSICPEPCGSMHTRCAKCGGAYGDCPFESSEPDAAALEPNLSSGSEHPAAKVGREADIPATMGNPEEGGRATNPTTRPPLSASIPAPSANAAYHHEHRWGCPWWSGGKLVCLLCGVKR